MGNDEALGALFGLGVIGFFGLVVLLLIYVPLVFYLLNLHRCFDAIRPEFRPPVPSALVWLALVPGLGILVLIAAVVMLATSLQKEGAARGTPAFGDGGMAIGLAAAILGVLSVIPFLGVILALGSLVCWILHWIKVSGFRRSLAGEPSGAAAPTWGSPAPTPAAWPQAAPPPPPPPPPPVPASSPPPPPRPVPSRAMAPPPLPVAAPPPLPGTEDSTVRFGSLENARIVCIVGVVQGMSFPVGNGVVVGRSQEADVVVPDNQISNRHAWIGPVQGRLILRDMKSTNGTFLNDNLGAPVQELELKEGDLIALGKHGQMKFRVSLG